MTDRRKPITQAFDQIRKHFTELENELKTGEEIQAIQNFRNAFARHIAEIAAKEEESRRIKAATEQERIEMRAYFKQAFTNDLVNTLSPVSYTHLPLLFNSSGASSFLRSSICFEITPMKSDTDFRGSWDLELILS